MGKYFLIGGKDDDLKSDYIEKELVSLTGLVNPTILYFPTALNDSEKSINHFVNTFKNLWVNINVVKFSKEEYSYERLDELFSKANIIYFGGGNTDVLYKKLKEHKVDKLLLKYKDSNKIFAGVSAGAIIYTNSGMGDSYSYEYGNEVVNYKMVKGFGILDIYICPHYQKPDLYIFNDEIKDKGLAYGIEDDTALFINDTKVYVYKANKAHSVYEFNHGLMKPLYEESTIHYLGPINTYSYLASLKYLNKFNIANPLVAHSTIRKAVGAVSDSDLAIVPLENSLDGYLGETLDLLFENDLEIIYDFSLPISFSLVSFSKLEDIKKVYVQFKAKGQCLNYLESLNASLIETDSNIESLNLAVENKDGYAAIVPNHMLDSYKFNTVIKNVCDKTNNYTRFVVLRNRRNESIKLNNYKCSLLLIPNNNESGMLYKMLKMFNDNKINLNAIMSRPTKEGLGSYYFYVEFLDKLENLGNIIKLFEAESQKDDFKIKNLGFYPIEGVE